MSEVRVEVVQKIMVDVKAVADHSEGAQWFPTKDLAKETARMNAFQNHCGSEGINECEARWHIRLMEENYHQADQFRWSLNSFLRSLKEVLQLTSMEVQNDKALAPWLGAEKQKLSEDQLIQFLYKQRDIIVHKSMLKPASRGKIGFTRGKGIKLGIGIPIDPLHDSKVAILRYIDQAAAPADVMGILYTKEDGSGEYTCVAREWRLENYPDKEVTELAVKSWERVAGVTYAIAKHLGATAVEPKLQLRDPNLVRLEISAVDASSNRLTVERTDGSERTYDPRRQQGVSVYREEERAFSVGDRVQLTAPSHELHVANRELGTVRSIGDEKRIGLKMDDGRQIEIDANKHPHLDHGYAVTSHSSQGQTAERVLVHVDTELGAKDLLNNRMAYVAISRGANDAQLFTNDREKLPAALGHDVSHLSAHAPEIASSKPAQKEIAPKQEHSYGHGISL